MSTTIKGNIRDFLETYDRFEKETRMKGFSTDQSIALYAIYKQR